MLEQLLLLHGYNDVFSPTVLFFAITSQPMCDINAFYNLGLTYFLKGVLGGYNELVSIAANTVFVVFVAICALLAVLPALPSVLIYTGQILFAVRLYSPLEWEIYGRLVKPVWKVFRVLFTIATFLAYWIFVFWTLRYFGAAHSVAFCDGWPPIDEPHSPTIFNNGGMLEIPDQNQPVAAPIPIPDDGPVWPRLPLYYQYVNCQPSPGAYGHYVLRPYWEFLEVDTENYRTTFLDQENRYFIKPPVCPFPYLGYKTHLSWGLMYPVWPETFVKMGIHPSTAFLLPAAARNLNHLESWIFN